MSKVDFTGLWRSGYQHESKTRNKVFEKVHYVKFHLKGTQLVMESLPDDDGAYTLARFSFDGKVATGTWEEQMAKHDYYEGTTYQGAAQLLLSEDGKTLTGKWVGVGKNMKINTGDWEIVRTDEQMPEKVVFVREV